MGATDKDMSQEQAEKEFDSAMGSLETMVRNEPCLIFSTTVCPWCDRAAEFFQSINRQCRKVELNDQTDGQSPMLGTAVALATQQRTVPNIFLFGKHVGGFDRLMASVEQCKQKDSALALQHADVCGFLSE
mmetsp:Transcript_118555/g.377918  ORF Transcript_118555/g.377918 Transcript_118555/m.377918 type:complete len:131 (-) Transcript_118555:139-531(-)|eukprot:CAMPEP_0177186344 /NCGR_PEP_ID=MMETSP0367-20130122/18596_1 /TAXON_ID=447022 ORGANISM="Scrippsiella hangoei-like, Strain SHHI-4" /NCGR_SAMPLE_ID=MMETSP0367 /ASSEMBLY_ACC=CAM_ASM_000362 /LENGTH=130 /DNA_ID=CAMNT_0018633631 /DNA_START=61 /DNA_END=453 /DNA_ORIENTATION=-